MCGIVAYVGHQEAYPIIMKGLRRLEYRGYDSAGIAILNGSLNVYKKKGKVDDLENFIGDQPTHGSVGIGHTRWATHGPPDDVNAHPHPSSNDRLVIVHNGIIENYAPIKEALEKKGHRFTSQTDTEVLVKLIEELQMSEGLSLEEAVREALTRVEGAYAIVVMDTRDPHKLVGARKGSPLVVGIGDEGDYYLASDATPIVEYTNRVIYLKDEEIAVLLRNGGVQVKSIRDNSIQTPAIHELDMEIERLEKGGYEHFMLKEIHEQPETILDAMRGRISSREGYARLRGLNEHRNRIANADRLIIIACGTSWHSGLIAEYLIEDLARMPVEVEYASEFRYRNPVLTERDVVIAISQSGETADTLAAIQLAKERGALVYGLVNTVGSSIARESDSGSYIHCGPEIGVASTKAFTGQVTVLTLFALRLAYERGTISDSRYRELLLGLENIPQKVEECLDQSDEILELAARFKDAENALYLGRGYNFPVALEGALKLKEISYIHAEGYPAAEMKHGPIALIDENMPVVVICTNMSAHDKIVSNIQEVKARKGEVIAIISEEDSVIEGIADHVVRIPATEEPLTPLLSVIPLQLLSYHIAVLRECNVDQPRNLAKSVTVE